MDTDRHFERAIQSGERNRATFQLVHNWCRHVRIRRDGGVGFVEAATDLPIGLLALACEHAHARGVSAPDLADAAVDFYDRNCKGCTHHKGVGSPDLSALVKERDARREQSQEAHRTAQEQRLARRSERTISRQTLKSSLPAVAASLIDCLEELDQDDPGDAAGRFAGAADLRPNAFTPKVIEHLFAQLEEEDPKDPWFANAGLPVLLRLGADPKRLAEGAMACLATGRAIGEAAQVVELHAALIDPARIAPAIPALADLANPERMVLSRERTCEPGALRALHSAHAKGVEASLEALLSEHDPRSVSLAAGAIEVLSRTDRSILSHFRRSLAARLRGAKYLIDERQTPFAGDDECIHRLQRALELALRHEPAETDALLESFREGADAESELRFHQIYTRALTGGHRRHGSAAYQHHPVVRVALNRLLRGLSSMSQDALRETHGALSYCADEYAGLDRIEFDFLLGSAVLLGDHLEKFDAATPAQQNFWNNLDRRAHRDALVGLQTALAEWAATAANGRARLTADYLAVLSGIPEARGELRNTLLTNASRFMGAPEGFNAALPILYTAMVGTSVRLRGAAARLIKELPRSRREDLPNLVHEAFCALLLDPYKFVHTSAIDALECLELPAEFERRAKQAVGLLINAYGSAKDDDSFLLECMGVYWKRYASNRDKNILKALYLEVLRRLKPYAAVHELRSLKRKLAGTDGFVAFTIGLLTEGELGAHQLQDVLTVLAGFDPHDIQKHRARLAEVASDERLQMFVALRVVEILSSAACWGEAARIADALYQRIPETPECHALKLRVNLARIATSLEEALSQSQLEKVPELAALWRTTETQIAEDQAAHAHQRSPIPSIPPAH